ncbi:MAG: SusC/RagA family TonB-linked outer membrane protein [Gemmatimonadaceae bacterium]|nr:SusC/RagA family TonB-linked outer membrane protein [Gemmatimonadaceae bacterium]
MHLSRLYRWASAFALGTTILGAASVVGAQQQGYTLRGRVVESPTQRPVPSVTVTLRGTRLGTLTGANGEFVFQAPVPAGTYSLDVAHIGHAKATRELQLGADHDIDVGTVALTVSAVELAEVVVTGTGAPTERRQLGNTVSSVSGEQVNEAPAAQSVDKALQGKVIGAVISQNNGQPGGGVSIRLRGTGSILGGAEPLIVIDGVIVENNSEALVSLGANASRGGAALTNSLSDIAPGDIDHIEVVKGAAAAALYGSRANNGVIQIFTKRGRQGASRVSYRAEGTTGKAPRYFELNTSPVAGRGDVLYGGASALGVPVTRYNYQDEVFQRSYGLTNQLTASGGSAATTYYASALWQNETGIMRSTGLNNINTRLSLTQQLSSKLLFTVNGNYIQKRTDFVPEGEQTQGVITTLIFTPTTFNPAYNPAIGHYAYSPILGTNPLDVIANWEARDNVNRFIGSFNTNWTPLSSLTVNYLFGFDRDNEAFTYYQPPRATSASFTGSVNNPTRAIQRFNNDLTLTHELQATSFLHATTTVGARQTVDHSDVVAATATGLSPGQTTVGGGGATPSTAQSIVEVRTLGGFAQERLGFGERLFVTGGLNYEASSAFGPDQRWQLFPRLGASWSVDQEPIFQNSFLAGPVSTLRLRLAYGETGGQPPSAYSLFNNYVVGSRSGLPALIPPSQAGNRDLKPERQREVEGGLDLGVLHDRASLEFTAYDKQSRDLVLGVSLPLSSGFSSQLQNVGALRNRGVEIGLNGRVLEYRGLRWSSRLAYAANKSRVEKLVTQNDTLIYGYLNAVAVGQPVGEFYGGYFPRDAQGHVVYAGAYDASCNIIAGTAGIIPSKARAPGNCKVSLKKFLGSPDPKFTLSWSNEFNVGAHTQISFLLDGRYGNKVANFSRRISEYFGAASNSSTETCVTPVATTYCQQTLNGDRHTLYEAFIENGSFVKLREASIRYTLDQPWVKRSGAQSATVSLSGRNLHTWTQYSGIDPEVNLFSANTVARGVEFGTSPIPRVYALGVTLNF